MTLDEHVLMGRSSSAEDLQSFAFKSTPEWNNLMSSSDVEISIVFNSETSADLYANGELHSSIVISVCDHTDTYQTDESSNTKSNSSNKGGKSNVLAFHSTAAHRMTIMSRKALQAQGLHGRGEESGGGRAPPRREASHIDHADIMGAAYRSGNVEGLHVEREQQHAQDSNYNSNSNSNSTSKKKKREQSDAKAAEAAERERIQKKKKRERREAAAAGSSCYVRLGGVPGAASVTDLLSFLGGLHVHHLFAVLAPSTNAAHTTAAPGEEVVLVYAECATLDVAGLAMKRNGESMKIKRASNSSGSGNGNGNGNGSGSGSGSGNVSTITTSTVVAIQAVPLAEAAWARAVGVRLRTPTALHNANPSHAETTATAATIERVIVDCRDRLFVALQADADTDTDAEEAEQGDSPIVLTLRRAIFASPAALLACSDKAGLVVPHPDTVHYAAIDGLAPGGVSRKGLRGTHESRQVAMLLPPSSAAGAIATGLRGWNSNVDDAATTTANAMPRRAQALAIVMEQRDRLGKEVAARCARAMGNCDGDGDGGGDDGSDDDAVARLYALYTRMAVSSIFQEEKRRKKV